MSLNDARHAAAGSSEGAVRVATIHETIGADLEGLGGFLRCPTCGHRKILGNVSVKLRGGWPKCCGYTMTWWTRRQIEAGEVPRDCGV